MARRKFTIKNVFNRSKPRAVRRRMNEKLHFEACETRKLMAADMANTIIDSTSFEDVEFDSTSHDVSLSKTWGMVVEIDGWLSTTGSIELRKDGNHVGEAAAGNNFIELNTDPRGHHPDAPNIFKTIQTVAGETYLIHFNYAGRPGYDSSVNRIEVLIDNNNKGIWSDDQSVQGIGSRGLDWKEAVIDFTANSTGTKIEFREVGSDRDFGKGMLIDDIRIYGKFAAVNHGPTDIIFC